MVTRHFLPTIFWLRSWAVFNSDALSLLEFSLILQFELAPPWLLRFIFCTACLFACTTCLFACTDCSHVHTWSRWLAHSGCFFALIFAVQSLFLFKLMLLAFLLVAGLLVLSFIFFHHNVCFSFSAPQTISTNKICFFTLRTLLTAFTAWMNHHHHHHHYHHHQGNNHQSSSWT